MKARFALVSLCTSSLLGACSAPGEAASEEKTPSAAATATAELPELTVIAIEHQDAGELAAILTDFIQDASGYRTEGFEPRVLADPRTNSLLILASTPRLAEIRSLAALIDVDEPE